MAAKRRIRALLIGLAVACAAAAPLGASYVGSRLTWFDVRRVEIAGAHLVPPHELLRVSGIHAGQNVFDDATAWEQALRAHPVVRDVRISARLPHTLRVRVREKEPVALVGREVLRLATASGEILPVDPAAALVDLPLLSVDLDDPTSLESARPILAEIGRLEAVDRLLLAEVSEIRAGPPQPSGTALTLVHRIGDIIVPVGASAARLDQLHAVIADLRARGILADSSIGRARIDVRYEDQVVVRSEAGRASHSPLAAALP